MPVRKRQRPFQQSSPQSESAPIGRNIQFLQLACILRPRPRRNANPADNGAARIATVTIDEPLHRNPIRPRSFQSRVIFRQPFQLRVAVRGARPIQSRILQAPADQRGHRSIIGGHNRANHV